MALIQLIPYNTKIDFISKRKITFSVVIFTTLLFLVSIAFKGLNYGVDFKGGIILEGRSQTNLDLGDMRKKLESLDLGDFVLQRFGGEQDFIVKVVRPEEDTQKLISTIQTKLGNEIDYRKVETVGPRVGEELIKNGLIAVLLALGGILIYIAFRFEWRFAASAIIALAHDCLLVLGMFSLFPLEFNETAITAILITASYSINDTIVVFDRIRENIQQFRKMSLHDLLNKSVNETLSRTILTVLTTFLSVLALYLLGGPVISTFVLPIMLALIIGTFSSIYVAAPLLLLFNIRYGKSLDEYEEKIRKEKEEIAPRFQEKQND